MLLKHPLEYLDIIETIKSNVDFKSNCIPLISTMKMNSLHTSHFHHENEFISSERLASSASK